MKGQNGLTRTLDRLKRVLAAFQRIIGADTPGLAARTAYYLALSVLPLFIFTLSLLRGLNLSPDEEAMALLFPASVRAALEESFAASPLSDRVTWLGLAVTVWTGSSAVWALMVGIYHALGEKTGDPPFIGRLVSLLFTVGLALALGLSLGLLVFGRSLAAPLFSGEKGAFFLSLLPWIGAAAGLFVFTLLLYRFTPGVQRPVRALWPGALFSAAGWLLVSWGFEFYVTHITRWAVIFGGIGLFLGLLFWLYLIALLTLLGARVNLLIKRKGES